MNLDELRSVQSKERKKDSLQNLRPSFYQEVGDYIADLEDERDRVAEQVDDPFSSPEVSQLTDEIETAKDVVEAVYERRMGKLVKQASLAAAGMAANDEGLTAEEQDLFADLVDRIGSNKSRVLDVLEGNAVEAAADGQRISDGNATDPTADQSLASDPEPAPTPPEPEPEPTAAPPEPDHAPADSDPPTADGSSGLSPAAAMGSGADDSPPAESGEDRPHEPSDRNSSQREPTDQRSASDEALGGDPSTGADSTADGEPAGTDATTADVDRVTVKITQDLGSILGVDAREYSLATDDVVTLPEENATPLLEREAAERLE
ncbi:hypothetical protein D8Y22_14195 [Salinadaptatus halalkaliphilus]|uniref:Gins51 C-terminal domain-containing protein n=1 Tax=Salinadaptatus halalkaliphilus TaxID=2419781 RepID=A0A4S3TKW3_9EURY|nr:hypothetical protein [Salinadaptatus halalkaliphilus]THE64210.1 hypothetical protein D8Y22_14195 [Salinadaptatus halalkaliphilus]